MIYQSKENKEKEVRGSIPSSRRYPEDIVVVCQLDPPLLELPYMTTAKLEDFKTISDAVKDPRVPYTTYWVRRLIVEKRVHAVRIGPEGKRGQWLVNVPDLLRYIKEMENT